MKDLIVPVSKIDPYCAIVLPQLAHKPVFLFTFRCLQSRCEISVALEEFERVLLRGVSKSRSGNSLFEGSSILAFLFYCDDLLKKADLDSQ